MCRYSDFFLNLSVRQDTTIKKRFLWEEIGLLGGEKCSIASTTASLISSAPACYLLLAIHSVF